MGWPGVIVVSGRAGSIAIVLSSRCSSIESIDQELSGSSGGASGWLIRPAACTILSVPLSCWTWGDGVGHGELACGASKEKGAAGT